MLELSEKYPSIAGFAQMIDKAADIMGDILYALGISADSADVMGVKAAQADKGVNDFDNVEEYISYLKNEIDLDKEKFDALSEGERVAYSITGMAIGAGAISEKLGMEIPADVVELISQIAEIGKIAVEAKEIISLAISLKDKGVDNLSDVLDCVKGEGKSDRLKTGEALVNALDEVNPGKGNDILNEIIDEIRG